MFLPAGRGRLGVADAGMGGIVAHCAGRIVVSAELKWANNDDCSV